MQDSPANTLDVLSNEEQEEELPTDVSPFHVMSAGFEDTSPAPDVSPAPSDLDGIDDDHPFSFGIHD